MIGRRLVLEDALSAAPVLVLLTAMVVVLWLQVSPQYGWTHPELLGTSTYIWLNPADGLAELLRKTFDWAAFDPNVNRVRPLNDFAEVVDAVARPFLVRAFDTTNIVLPTTLLTVMLVPLTLYAVGQRCLGSRTLAVSLVLIFVFSIGFLSLVVAYIRPAKKLNVLFLCLMLYCFEWYRTDPQRRSTSSIWWGIGYCFLSLFSDEQGLFNWIIMMALYFRCVLRRSVVLCLTMLLMPLAFITIVQYLIPAIYSLLSVHGSWSALSDGRKFEVFLYLLDSQFYQAAAIALGRSLLSFFGILWQPPALVVAGIAILVLPPAVAFLISRNEESIRWLVAALLVIAGSTYMTLLDWYPFPYEVSYLGSYNYYYHVAMIVPIFLWLLFGIVCLRKVASARLVAPLTVMVVVLTAVCVVANVKSFRIVNDLVRLIHFVPYIPTDVFTALERAHTTDTYAIAAQPERVERQFDSSMAELVADPADDPGFEAVFEAVGRMPIMTDDHFRHLVRSFFPWRHVTVELDGPP